MRRLSAVLAAWLPAASHAAEAAAKDPLAYSLKEYGLVLGVSVLAGVVSWMDKVRRGHLHAWNIMAFVGEVATACLAGLLCFWLCEWQDYPRNLTAALTGLSGYMGTRALVLLERKASQKFGVTGHAGLDSETPPRS